MPDKAPLLAPVLHLVIVLPIPEVGLPLHDPSYPALPLPPLLRLRSSPLGIWTLSVAILAEALPP